MGGIFFLEAVGEMKYCDGFKLGTLACILHHQGYQNMVKAAGPLLQISITRIHVIFSTYVNGLRLPSID